MVASASRVPLNGYAPASGAISHAELLRYQMPPARPLVRGLLDEASAATLAGPPGTGKTWLALSLARAVASGADWLGRYPTSRAAVLYVDEESHQRGLQARLKLLDAADPLGEDAPLWFAVGLGLRIDVEGPRRILNELIERHRPGLVVFDSFTRFHGANENDAGQMADVFANFQVLRRSYGCAVLLIDHLRKKGLVNDPEDMLRGSTEKRAWPDSIFFATPGGRGSLTVSHVKARFAERLADFVVDIQVDNEEGAAAPGRRADAGRSQDRRRHRGGPRPEGPARRRRRGRHDDRRLARLLGRHGPPQDREAGARGDPAPAEGLHRRPSADGVRRRGGAGLMGRTLYRTRKGARGFAADRNP